MNTELAALCLSIDNARAFLRGEIVGEPEEETLAREIWSRYGPAWGKGREQLHAHMDSKGLKPK